MDGSLVSSSQFKEESACCTPWGTNKKQNVGIDDADLAKEMNALSVEEREKVYDDIHGVAQLRKETPEFLEECIQKFDAALKDIPVKRRKNYNRAILLCPKLQTDKRVKLMFLRADEYNASHAAVRMTRFYDLTRELFGEDKLGKTITIDDLSEEDLHVIKSGQFVELPFKDQFGRPILFSDTTKLDLNRMSIFNQLRCFLFQAMAHMHDDEVQRKGLSTVVYVSADSDFSTGRMTKWLELIKGSGYAMSSLPFRMTCFRVCHNDPRTEVLTNVLRATMGKHNRLRIRTHVGSELEHDYFLMTLGIDKRKSLIQRAKEGYKEMHQRYIQHRREWHDQDLEKEAKAETESGLVAYPAPNDVLLGRGVPWNCFPGSVQWNNLIRDNMDRYAQGNDFSKTCVSLEVVKAIRDGNGRFLQRSPDGWKIIDDSTARLKTASAFRSRMKPNASASKKANGSNSAYPNAAKRQRLGA